MTVQSAAAQPLSPAPSPLRGLYRLIQPAAHLTTEETRLRTRLLSSILLAIMFFGVLILADLAISSPEDLGDPDSIAALVGVVILLGLYIANRFYGKITAAAVGLVMVTFLVFVVTPFPPSSRITLLYTAIVPILLTATFFRIRAVLVIVIAVIAASLALAALVDHPDEGEQFPYIIQFFLIVSPIILVFINHTTALENARKANLEEANRKLRQSEATLEKRVEDRTRDLQIVLDVGRQITTLLDTDKLLEDVVKLTTRSFGFYYAAVYLYDEDTKMLMRVAENTSARDDGQRDQTAKVITLGKSTGVVARAAEAREAVVVEHAGGGEEDEWVDVAQTTLRRTRSEAAIPMLLGTRLIGVFDLQSNFPAAFPPEVVRVLTSLAEQTAVAVRNAQLFAETKSARAAAEKANSVKSQFLAAMSHELRTPLNGIINFTEFVADGTLGEVNEEQRNALREAIDNANHLLALINDVLDISKIESDSLKLFIEDGISLAEEFNSVLNTAKTLLGDKPVMLVTDLEADLPFLRGDRRRIRQIVLNIVANACKFTDDGSITLRAKRTGEDVIIAIQDTGPGIAPEDHPAVFEAFRQTGTGIRHGVGTGLGMPISKRLAEAHGGRLWLESAPGSGSTFYVALPIRSETLEPVV